MDDIELNKIGENEVHLSGYKIEGNTRTRYI